MVDPVEKVRRESAEAAVSARGGGLTKAAADAALKKTTLQPKGIEVGYQAFLVSVQRGINKHIRKALPSLYSLLDLVRVDSVRTDGLSDDIVLAFNSLRATVTALSTKTDGVLVVGVQRTSAKTAAFNDVKYDTTIMDALGIGDVSANIEQGILDGWVTENVQLVGNMNVEQLGKLETRFLRALRDGSRSSQVTADVANILGVSESRARLIARDQVGKLDGQLSRQKQTEAGIDSYAWRGALDSRERPTHVAREGVIFKWSDPPEGGHPGQDIQCRCSAEPDLSSLLGSEFAPDPRSEADFSEATPEKRAETRKIQGRKRARRARRAVS